MFVVFFIFFFFFQAEDGIRDKLVTGVQTCALPISARAAWPAPSSRQEVIDGVARYGFRPTPPNASTSAGRPPPRSAGSGRQRGHDTTPGSTSSRPEKKPAICSGLRRWYGTAPVSS